MNANADLELFEDIFNQLKTFYNLSESTSEKLFALSKFRTLKPGEILDNVGDLPSKIYVVLKGYCRSYFRLETGKEYTKTFFKPLDIFASFNALVNQEPSECIYETLTDCTILELNYFEYKALKESNVEVLAFHANFMEYLICQNDIKHKELLSMNATQRYLRLRQYIPDIDCLIPQYQIATYLSITPVQLSRIRAKL